MGESTDKNGEMISRRRMLQAIGGAGSMAAASSAAASQQGGRPLHYRTIFELSTLIEAGDLSPVELTGHMLQRIEKLDSQLHSYVTVTPERAMESARVAEAEIAAGRYRGPLHGIPIGIKDLCNTRGVPTMAGTWVLRDFVPDTDATVVAKLDEAGAISLGKLTLCEGAMAPYHSKLKVPVNPWDATRWSGVSSSGSGVATAAGLCFGSIGTDTGGSIRYPSSANGCVGLKPTYGRVSRFGVFPLSETMDHIGPMTRSVEDAAIMFEAMAGYDPQDSTSLAEPVPSVRFDLAQGIRGMKIGFDPRYASDGVDTDVVNAVRAVVEKLAELGAEIIELDIELGDVASEIWGYIACPEAAIAHRETFPSKANEYGHGFREDLEWGRSLTAMQYAEANRRRLEMAARVNRVLASVDCFVCPSMSNAAQTKTEDSERMTWEEWRRLVHQDVFSKPFNFAGVPTLCVPCGFSKEGLPLNAQFVAGKLKEAMIFRAGYAYEQASFWHRKHPPL